MNSKVSNAIIAGVVGTALMTMVMFAAPMMGLPKMSAPDMLAGMMGVPVIVGWLMHFMIGVIFALVYSYFFTASVRISNIYVKGALFGVAVFVFAQIVMAMASAMSSTSTPEGSMALMMMGSLMGHVIYGVGVSKIVK